STVSPLTELVPPDFDSYLPSLADKLSITLGQPFSNPPPVFKHQSPTFPTAVDVVIIGSGITGNTAARTLLSNSSDLRVAMLDAREACSGETGRNGGHIKPNAWELFPKLAAIFAREKARKVTEFRMGILDKMIAIADAEGVEAVDVYFDTESWAAAKSCLGIYLEEFPEEIGKWETYKGEEARQVSIQFMQFLWRADCLQGVRYDVDWMGGSTALIHNISGIITILSNS
ncbi:hypothetical protein B9Z19DRAFT_1093990, partial [Tuber borchii]